MARLKLTRELAFAASLDGGNRSMRPGGRQSWNKQDQSVAVREFNRLWPQCKHKVERGFCAICFEEDGVKSVPIS